MSLPKPISRLLAVLVERLQRNEGKASKNAALSELMSSLNLLSQAPVPGIDTSLLLSVLGSLPSGIYKADIPWNKLNVHLDRLWALCVKAERLEIDCGPTLENLNEQLELLGNDLRNLCAHGPSFAGEADACLSNYQWQLETVVMEMTYIIVNASSESVRQVLGDAKTLISKHSTDQPAGLYDRPMAVKTFK